MTTRFNYFTYALIILLLIVFVVVLSNYLTIFEIIKKGERNLIPFYIGMTCVAIGLVYGIYIFCYALFNFKYIITFHRNQLTIKDALTKTQIELPFDIIDNLSLENFAYRTVFTTFSITTKSGKKYRILNFFILNFKDVRTELKSLKQRKVALKVFIKTNTVSNEWV